MSDRPKASTPKAPSAKSGAAATSWLAGFITRAAAGIVYAVVFILCLVLGIVPTAIFVSVMSGLCCYEFFRMTKLDGKVANERLGIAAAVLFPLSALGDSLLLNALLFALMLAVGIWYVWSARTRISDVAVTLVCAPVAQKAPSRAKMALFCAECAFTVPPVTCTPSQPSRATSVEEVFTRPPSIKILPSALMPVPSSVLISVLLPRMVMSP